MVTSPVAVAIRAEERFDETEGSEPSFVATGPGSSLLISFDPRFKAAIATGVADVSRLLADAEVRHAERRAGTIDQGDRDGGGRMEEAA